MKKGGLKFAGKCGTGFDAPSLKELHRKMKLLHTDGCPFTNLPERRQGRWSQNITPKEMSLCRWTKPLLVCQVRFTEWTDDGKLRHPALSWHFERTSLPMKSSTNDRSPEPV